MELERKIEAILFTRSEPITVRRLGEFLKTPENEVRIALEKLENTLKNRGLALVRKSDEIFLGTAPDLSSLIEGIEKEELKKELSRASLEVLSIILYKSEAARSEIDWIRGVNSSFVLRQLLLRGLVEREIHPADARRYLYRPSFELVKYLGITKTEELPRFAEMREALNKNLASAETEANESIADER